MMFGLFRRKLPADTAAAAVSAPAPPATCGQDPAPPTPDGTGALPVSIAPQAAGPALWQDVAYGMTLEEVRGTRVDAIASTDTRRLHDGALSLLQIPSLELAGHAYSVHFYFKDDRLTQVTIATNGSPSIADFQGIVNALRLRYGREVAFKNSPDSFSTGEWLSADGTNVVLVFHEEISCLNINFQYRYAAAAMQL